VNKVTVVALVCVLMLGGVAAAQESDLPYVDIQAANAEIAQLQRPSSNDWRGTSPTLTLFSVMPSSTWNNPRKRKRNRSNTRYAGRRGVSRDVSVRSSGQRSDRSP
jgi:hypothetical protein